MKGAGGGKMGIYIDMETRDGKLDGKLPTFTYYDIST